MMEKFLCHPTAKPGAKFALSHMMRNTHKSFEVLFSFADPIYKKKEHMNEGQGGLQSFSEQEEGLLQSCSQQAKGAAFWIFKKNKNKNNSI